MSARDEARRFARAYVALQYVCGARDAALGAGLSADVSPRLLAELRHPSREQRTRSLAAALLDVARAIEQRGLR